MPPPKDPIAQMHALIEGLRLEMHDAFSEMHEQRSKPAEEPKGDQVGGVIAVAAMLEARIKTGEQAAMSAVEALLTPIRTAIDGIASNYERAAQATAENTAVTKQVLTVLDALAKTLGKPRNRTGVVQLPDGPLSMTITEH